MSKKREFWYFLLNGTLDDNTGVYSNFYTYGTHCGNCLAKSIEIAENEGIINPELIETCRLDNLEEFELPENAIEMNSDVFMLSNLNSYELKKEETEFTPPTGIAFGTDENEYETDLIKECFVAYGKNENEIFEFELVADNCRLIKTFFKAIDFLPKTDGFWIYLRDHWENEQTELFAGKDLISKENIIEFLKSNNESTLKNGFIDIVVHSKKGETNLTLDEHKKIRLHTKDESVFNEFIGEIIKIGFEQTRDYYNIEFGYHHWHYRTNKSLNRNKFKEMLSRKNFEKIELN
ncbi:hypothetical protein [Psychroserpens ponticola]|uniref:Uncharacterized protein n=1 Tax=Psychroserpens ponticola TaxID=2932268 RepID=A0ABY7S2F9_9FLAO|nr:hypothetical protein [Psychroserpens ponticola]WCO03596.1 hypothetical protein MUN68_008815 [Psychroserpens ponticola]